MDNETYLKILSHIEERMHRYPENGSRDAKWEFFSALDHSYQRPDFVDPLLESIYTPNLILTGEFGEYVVKRLTTFDPPLRKDYMLFNGHIREGSPPILLDYNRWGRNVEEESFIQTWMLLDDSNYSGRTRFVLEHYMRTNHANPITNTVVIYNGAPDFSPQINALYSWHAMHGLKNYTFPDPFWTT